MAQLPASIWLSQEERRALARGRQQKARSNSFLPTARGCLYCCGHLTNGRAVCSDECDDGWWAIVPTVDGELWEQREPATSFGPKEVHPG
jgi:hypothetical protein